MLYGVTPTRPPLEIFSSAELQMKAEIRVLVLRDLARLNHVPLEENAFPWLHLGGLNLGGAEQWNQVVIPYD
jgi:hypothetical protein